MVNILIGCILGFLSGLGVGGGSLLLLWLTVFQGASQDQARLMNLMFFIPCALIATLFRWKQGKLQWKIVIPAAAAGIAGSFLGSWLGGSLDREVLEKGLGMLFMICGIRELLYKEK